MDVQVDPEALKSPQFYNNDDEIVLTVTMLLQYGDYHLHVVTAPLTLTTCAASIQIDVNTAPEYEKSAQESLPHTVIMAPIIPKKTTEIEHASSRVTTNQLRFKF